MNPLTAEFGDVIKGLVLLAFVLGPVLRKLVAGLNDPARRTAAPRRRPSPPPGSPTSRGSATWEELMRGAVPEPPEMPDVDLALDPEPVVGGEPSWSPLAASIGVDELGTIPDEEQLERHGVATGPMLDPLGPIGAVGAPTQARELQETASSDWGAETEVTRARILRSRMHRTGWRDGVLLGEILGSPLALREDWSHSGPPLGQRPNPKHG